MKGEMTVTHEIIRRFVEYGKHHPTWGSLHVIFDDGNFKQSAVDGCLLQPALPKDSEGHELLRILQRCSTTQRIRISNEANRIIMYERAVKVGAIRP